MKKFYTIILGAVLSLAAVSCQQEVQDNWTPGEADDAFCYGVYFPVQEASGYHIYSPTDAPKVVITVSRTNTSGAITVPVEASFSEEGIFEATPIAFADGQAETTFTLSFPAAEEGKVYSASFLIADNAYASVYSSNPVAFDFSVMRVEMKTFMTEDGKTEAKVTYYDPGFWEENHDDLTIQYYEVDGVRYCETVGGKLKEFFGKSGSDGTGPWGADVQLKFKWYTKNQVTVSDGEDYDFIEIEPQYMGWESSGNPVYFGDYFNMRADMGLSNSAASSLAYYSGSPAYDPSYYDGHGGFVFNLAYWIHTTTSWYGVQNTIAIADGYLRVDYSLNVSQAGVCAAGKVPVKFTLGPDVAKVVYEFKEGELSNINTEKAISELKADSEQAITEAGTYEFELEKTGVYTLVAIAVDAEGKIQNSASTLVTYTAAADVEEYATVINGGLGSAEKYIPKGVNTDSALEVYLYGEDLVEVKFGVFSLVDLAGGYADCVAKVKASKAVSAEVLDAINGDGYVDVVTGLLPGTEYYLLAYATNSYTETVELFGSVFTTGDPLPIYQNFSADSYYDDGELENAAAWCGTWNLYGVDYYGSTGLREYLGKSVISASETPTEGPDDNGFYDEYVNVSGLFGDLSWLSAYGIEVANDAIEMDVYAGVMYTTSNTLADGAEGYTVYLYSKGQNQAGYDYAHAYWTCFIPVMDGYYAFVDTKYGASYNFTGLGLYLADAGWLSIIYDQLLVDPTKDENGLAPATIKHAIAKAEKTFNECVVENSSSVLTEKGRVRNIIDSYNKKMSGVTMYNNVAGIHGERPLVSANVKGVTYLGKTMTSGYARTNARPVL